jgi:hypothetical protein
MTQTDDNANEAIDAFNAAGDNPDIKPIADLVTKTLEKVPASQVAAALSALAVQCALVHLPEERAASFVSKCGALAIITWREQQASLEKH